MGGNGQVVRVTAGPDDVETASQIARFLTADGYRVQRDAAPVAEVVLLSATALSNPGFRGLLLWPEKARVVPVALGSIQSGDVPARLATLNWILWNASSPESSLAQILSAVQTDVRRFRSSQGIEARAASWAASGHDSAELLGRMKDVRKGHADVASEASRTGEEPEPVVQAYLMASRRRAKKLRRRSVVRRVLFSFLLLAVAAGTITLIEAKTRDRQRFQLQEVATESALAPSRPDVTAVKLAPLLAMSLPDHRSTLLLTTSLVEELSRPWPLAVVGLNTDKSVNALAIGDDHDHVWIASGSGDLDRYDITRNRVTAKVWVGSPVYQVVTTPDDQTQLVATRDTVAAVRNGTVVHTLKGSADQLAVSADGEIGALVRGRTLTAVHLVKGGGSQHTSTWTSVLAVSPSGDHGIVALVRRGPALELVSPMTGEIQWRQPFPRDPLEAGAVSTQGNVAVSSREQLWWSNGMTPLRPSGWTLPDQVTAMAATSDGRVYVASDPRGVQGYDVRFHTALPEVCSNAGDTTALTLSPDDVELVCSSYDEQSVWQAVAPDRPRRHGPDYVSGRGPIQSVEPRRDGLIAVTTRAHGTPTTKVFDPGAVTLRKPEPADYFLPSDVHFDGRVVAWATNAAGTTLALGSSAGEVVVFDMDGRARTALDSIWTAPDHSPVRWLRLSGDRLVVGTGTATWAAPSCSGCGPSPSRIVREVLARQLPCYSSNITMVVPRRILNAMGTATCVGSGL